MVFVATNGPIPTIITAFYTDVTRFIFKEIFGYQGMIMNFDNAFLFMIILTTGMVALRVDRSEMIATLRALDHLFYDAFTAPFENNTGNKLLELN